MNKKYIQVEHDDNPLISINDKFIREALKWFYKQVTDNDLKFIIKEIKQNANTNPVSIHHSIIADATVGIARGVK